ncbi:sulfite reductase subunit C [Anaeromicrobium sediminis]|uniref:Sulfite reductase subunit C n=1 Tax=Anaeromicrobium sediminis TaxID=1478221 RepID=A0A267MGJ1_9FIRM|nr:sulfite reductase subunit C [Anaeromicrobium sediminis]PAB58704.1 sulfite reductase subunit C [Anaeromicrobium sediminis]
MSVNVKKVKKNAYRITKVRGKTALRVRIPGGHMEAKHFAILQEIAEKFGDGGVHLTTRQGFELSGIDYDKIPEVNKMVAPIIEDLELNIGVEIANPENGYPAAGTRNVSACIGNRVCQIANDNTTRIAQNIEKAIFPNHYHFKIAVTGCPNDCIKAHMQDFGIICTTEPQYDESRCISCEACVKNCRIRVTEALTMENRKVKRDHRRCLGCGECVLKCPTLAMTRSTEKRYRMVIMGRTGKKNPRLARTFLRWVDEDTIIKVIKNAYEYVDRYIDRSLPKEHVGYIVDRTGYEVFKKEVLEGVNLPEGADVAEYIDFGGYKYERDAFLDKQ